MALSSGSIERRLANLVSVSESIQAQGGGASAARGRGPLPEELMPDAMHFMTAMLDGMTEVQYARRHPRIYQRLCERE